MSCSSRSPAASLPSPPPRKRRYCRLSRTVAVSWARTARPTRSMGGPSTGVLVGAYFPRAPVDPARFRRRRGSRAPGNSGFGRSLCHSRGVLRVSREPASSRPGVAAARHSVGWRDRRLPAGLGAVRLQAGDACTTTRSGTLIRPGTIRSSSARSRQPSAGRQAADGLSGNPVSFLQPCRYCSASSFFC